MLHSGEIYNSIGITLMASFMSLSLISSVIMNYFQIVVISCTYVKKKKIFHWHSTWTHTNTQSLDLTKAIHSQSGTSFMSIALKERMSIDNEERQKLPSLSMQILPFTAIIIKDVPDWEWAIASLNTVYSCVIRCCVNARFVFVCVCVLISAANYQNLRFVFNNNH